MVLGRGAGCTGMAESSAVCELGDEQSALPSGKGTSSTPWAFNPFRRAGAHAARAGFRLRTTLGEGALILTPRTCSFAIYPAADPNLLFRPAGPGRPQRCWPVKLAIVAADLGGLRVAGAPLRHGRACSNA